MTAVRDTVSAEEWAVRVDLAACYRLLVRYGWEDLVFTHITMRVPGADDQFLINPYGLFFDEITASSLVKIDLSGTKVDDSPFPVNRAGNGESSTFVPLRSIFTRLEAVISSKNNPYGLIKNWSSAPGTRIVMCVKTRSSQP